MKLVSIRTALVRFALVKSASIASAPLRSALFKFASLTSAFLKSAPTRLDQLRSALLRFAPLIVAPLRLTRLRLAPLRLLLLRSTSCRSGSSLGFCCRYVFQAVGPCLISSSCCCFAMFFSLCKKLSYLLGPLSLLEILFRITPHYLSRGCKAIPDEGYVPSREKVTC
jgi:hypothetical protein